MLFSSKIDDQLKEDRASSCSPSDDKSCFYCGASFNFLFRKKFVCVRCGHNTCGQCSTWESSTKTCICNDCDRKILQTQNKQLGNETSTSSLTPRLLSNLESDADLESDSGYDPTSRENSLRPRRIAGDLFPATKDCVYHRIHVTDSDKENISDSAVRSEEIREHIESLVEKIIHAELENANVQRLYDHPECVNIRYQRIEVIVCSFQVALEHYFFANSFSQGFGLYDRMLGCYQGRLSEALTQLGFSLHMAIANQPLNEGVTPTCAHYRLKEIVDEILEQVVNLPPMQASELKDHKLAGDVDDESDFLYSQSYEDILATAILNRVIEKHQNRLSSNNQENNDTIIDSDSKRDHNDKTETPVSQNNVDVESDAGTESAGEDFSWAENKANETLSYTLKEEIEEITTTIEDSESESEQRRVNGGNEVVKTTSRNVASSLDHFYTDLDFNESKKVPFPELGLDVVHARDESEKEDISLLVSEIDSWEENWRFRKKKTKNFSYGNVRGRNVVCENPVPMLIPNPQDESVRTRIGSRDIDDLSDLSEKSSEHSDNDSTSDTDPELCFHSGQDGGVHKSVIQINDLNRSESVSPKPIPLPRKSKLIQEDVVDVPKYAPPGHRNLPPTGLRLILPVENRYTVEFGEKMRFTCHVTAQKDFNVVWFFGGDLINEGEDYHMYREEDSINLEIKEIKDSDDNAVYSCVVYNKDGELWVDFHISIAVAIPEFIVHLVDCKITVDSSAVFTCTVRGYPVPKVRWYCDGAELAPGPNVKIVNPEGNKQWSLILDHVNENFNGCEVLAMASNPLGQSISSACLYVVNPRNVPSLTHSVNTAQDQVHLEAEKMLVSANQNSASVALRQLTGEALDVVSSAERVIEAEKRQEEVYVGSIAEREHEKWRHPTATIVNNPYSRENLTKRATSKRSQDALSKRAPSLDENDEIGMSKETYERELQSRYGRDYIVNKTDQEIHSNRISVESSINSVEEKMYVTAGKMSSLELKIDDLESQVEEVDDDTGTRRICDLEDKVVTAAAQIKHNDNKLSFVETQVARLQQAMGNSPPPKLQRSQSDRTSMTTPKVLSRTLSHNTNTSNNNRWLSLEKQNLRASSMEHLNVQSTNTLPTERRINPGSRKLSSSVTCLYRPSSTDVTSTRNVRDEIPNLPSVKELVTRYQEGIQSLSTPQSTLERNKRSVISVVNVNNSSSAKMEASNVILVERSNSLNNPSKPKTSRQLPVTNSTSNLDTTNVQHLSRKFSESNKVDPPVRRIHSLTARSLSKEFREAVQRNLPRQNRVRSELSRDDWNINLQSNHSREWLETINSNSGIYDNSADTDNTHGYTSDESASSSNYFPCRYNSK